MVLAAAAASLVGCASRPLYGFRSDADIYSDADMMDDALFAMYGGPPDTGAKDSGADAPDTGAADTGADTGTNDSGPNDGSSG
jgi:hypothetical protein